MNGRSRSFLALSVAFLLGVLAATVHSWSLASPLQELTFFGLTAAAVVLLSGLLAIERLSQPLRRLAQTMSEMARTGQLASTFPTAGGGKDVRRIEETFRALIETLEESRLAQERSYVEAVGAVVMAADARDHETSGHSFRVALYAQSLARSLGLAPGQLQAIEWGALLHDVGKIAVPDGILRKPGPLTEEEWQVMRQHPAWGFDMLAEVSFLQEDALDIVYSHHERWDGSGYPRGVAGEQIPLAARIFAVVDTYDAITSDRPYRRASGHGAAMAELQRIAGKQLDPRIVEAFRGVPEMELRKLGERCRRIHPGINLPTDLLESLTHPARGASVS